MSDAPKSGSVIELSTVFFCEGPIPRAISLHDCALDLRARAPLAITALYGIQSKQEGFMAARDYAERNRLNFTVIDFLVATVSRVNPGKIKAAEFPDNDFLALHRLARNGSDEIASLLLAAGVAEADTKKPAEIFLERPQLLSLLLQQREMAHVKVVAFQARPIMCDHPLTVGAVPYAHWNAIVEATCRLNPTTRVTLDAPAPQDLPKNAPAPRKKNVPRAR